MLVIGTSLPHPDASLLQHARGPGRSIFLRRVVRLDQLGIETWNSPEHFARASHDHGKCMDAQREVRGPQQRSTPGIHELRNRRELFVPARCSNDNRTAGKHARGHVRGGGVRIGELDRDIRAAAATPP